MGKFVLLVGPGEGQAGVGDGEKAHFLTSRLLPNDSSEPSPQPLTFKQGGWRNGEIPEILFVSHKLYLDHQQNPKVLSLAE